MAYGITCTGTKVKYWVEQGDSLPLYWKIQKPDQSFAPLTAPVTFTHTLRPGGTPTDVTLTVSGDAASGVLDSSSLVKGVYDVEYYDPGIDVSLRGTLEVR